MRLYVLDSGKMVYLDFNKPVHTREDIPRYFDVTRKTFSRNDVRFLRDQNYTTSMAIFFGVITGLTFGLPGAIIGAIVGAFLGAKEQFNENQRVKEFSKNDF